MSSQTDLVPPFFVRCLRLGALGLGVCAFWVWTSRGSVFPLWIRRKPRPTDTKLIAVLDKLCSEFHQIFSELAQMVVSVQRTISHRGLQDALPSQQMESILMQQGFQLRLQAAEAAVLDSCAWSKADLEEACRRHADNAGVATRVGGLNEMYGDAIRGVLPLLPGFEVPERLQNPDVILKILGETQQRKIELFDEIFQNASPEDLSSKSSPVGTLPSPQLNAQLTSAAERAEKGVLERHMETIESARLYHHALAHHSRNEDFKRKKSLMDELHSDQVVAVMKRGLNRTHQASPLLVVLHDKLEHVKAEVLSLLIESAEDTNRPLLCLVTKKTNDAAGMRLLDDLSSEMSALEKGCQGLEASFLFTEFDEFNQTSIKNVPKFSAKELPCYLLFKGNTFERNTKNLAEAVEFVQALWKLESNKTTSSDAQGAVNMLDKSEIVQTGTADAVEARDTPNGPNKGSTATAREAIKELPATVEEVLERSDKCGVGSSSIQKQINEGQSSDHNDGTTTGPSSPRSDDEV